MPATRWTSRATRFNSLDAWGHPIKLVLCGSSMPHGQGGERGMRDFMLVSAGEDGRFDTSDDLAFAREGTVDDLRLRSEWRPSEE